MKQSGRVTLLTVSSAVAVFGFITLWMTRPQVNNEMIEIARERQLQPLIEVDEPARSRRTVEEERQREVEQLYPYIQQKILSDQTITDNLIKQIDAEIDRKVRDEVSGQLASAIEADLASFREEVAQQFADTKTWTEEEIQAKLDEFLPQAVDSLIPLIVPTVYEDFEANKADYIARLASDLGPNMEGVAEDTIEAQRSGIIAEAVERALDEIEQNLEKSAAEAVPAAEERKIITAPTFEIYENPTVLSPEEYSEQRSTVRQERIQEVVDMLSSGESGT